MAKHVRNGDAYGDGMFFFTQPVGAGGGYADGMFFFTQPVGAGGGYAGPMMVRRAHGFVHPSAARSNYGAAPRLGGGAPAIGSGPMAAMRSSGGRGRFEFAGRGVGGAGAEIRKAELDKIEQLARALGKYEYWYALRTSYLNPEKRTVASFPVINDAASAKGDMKARDLRIVPGKVREAVEEEKGRVRDAQAALDAKLGLVLSRPLTLAQSNALATFVAQARRNGAFAEIYRNKASTQYHPVSPTMLKLIITNAGIPQQRTDENRREVMRDFVRLSPMSDWSEGTVDANGRPKWKSASFGKAISDARRDLEKERYTVNDKAVNFFYDVLKDVNFQREIKSLRAGLEAARAFAANDLKEARAAVEKLAGKTSAATGTSGAGGAAAATAGGAAADTSTGGGVAADTSTGGGETPPSVIPAVQPRILTEGYEVTPMESPIMVSGDTSAPAEASFFEKYKTEILVGGAIAAVLLFRKQLGIGGDASSAKE
jgi:hypothetical protein